MKTFKRVYQLSNWHVSNVKLPSCVPFPSCSNVASLVDGPEVFEAALGANCSGLLLDPGRSRSLHTGWYHHFYDCRDAYHFQLFPFSKPMAWLCKLYLLCFYSINLGPFHPHQNCQLKSKIGDAARRLQCSRFSAYSFQLCFIPYLDASMPRCGILKKMPRCFVEDQQVVFGGQVSIPSLPNNVTVMSWLWKSVFGTSFVFKVTGFCALLCVPAPTSFIMSLDKGMAGWFSSPQTWRQVRSIST